MFSGIVEVVGNVIEIEDSADGRRLKIKAATITPQLQLGESVSVSGCCLTVVDFSQDSHDSQEWFAAEVVHETLRKTKLGQLKVGSEVNLERAAKLGDRLGGHLVSGHIDAVGKVTSIVEEGFSKWVSFELDSLWAPYFIEKGSITVDGVSLTVAKCAAMEPAPGGQSGRSAQPFSFSVALIPHTLEVTTLGDLVQGDSVNIETDIIARYVVSLLKQYLGNRLPSQIFELLDVESRTQLLQSAMASNVQMLETASKACSLTPKADKHG